MRLANEKFEGAELWRFIPTLGDPSVQDTLVLDGGRLISRRGKKKFTGSLPFTAAMENLVQITKIVLPLRAGSLDRLRLNVQTWVYHRALSWEAGLFYFEAIRRSRMGTDVPLDETDVVLFQTATAYSSNRSMVHGQPSTGPTKKRRTILPKRLITAARAQNICVNYQTGRCQESKLHTIVPRNGPPVTLKHLCTCPTP